VAPLMLNVTSPSVAAGSREEGLSLTKNEELT